MKTYKSLDYLYIALANHFGKDKLSFEDRIQWAKENWNKVSPKDADEPAEFYHAQLAMQDYLEKKPTGFMVSMDATSSGPQILSLVSGDVNGALMTNAVALNSEKASRRDCYTEVYNHYKELKGGVINGITRQDCKEAVMQRCYGGKSKVKKLFGDDAPIFEQALKDCMPMVYWTIECLLWAHKAYGSEKTQYSWVMPDGFEVLLNIESLTTHQFKVNDELITFYSKELQADKYYKGLPANVTHSIDSLIMREMLNRCMFEKYIKFYEKYDVSINLSPDDKLDDYKSLNLYRLIELYHQTKFLSSRVFEFLTGTNIRTLDYDDAVAIIELIKSLPSKAFNLVGIHDSYHCHVNYVNDLRQQYQNVLYELANSNTFMFIIKQLGIGLENTFNGKFTNISSLVKNEEYAIC